jgi:YD repeat-containing protein
MRIQWDTTGDVDQSEAVKPTYARGTTPFRAALRAAEQWTDLKSQEEPLRLAGEVGSGNFTFTAPVAHYPGRGEMSLNLDLVYNSRVWQRIGPTTARKMVFDIDDDWPAPGWSLHLGRLVSLGAGAAMVVEPDGTRRPFKEVGRTDTGNDLYVDAQTTDGSHIIYQTRWRDQGIPPIRRRYLLSGWLARTDGTRVDFDFTTRTTLHATRLTDRNGNMITAEYDGGHQGLKTITDTCGRVVKFAYRELTMGDMVLAKVTGPAPNQEWSSAQTDTDLVVLNIGNRPLKTSFTDPVHEPSDRSRTISGLYYPATHTGYWLPVGSYSTYGMLKRVQACRGMSLTTVGATAESGPLIVAGPVTWQREYNYPDAPGLVQADAPTYTTMSERWALPDTGQLSDPVVTHFSVQRTADQVRTELTFPDGTKTVQEVPASGQQSGLLKELRVLDPWGKELQRTHVAEWKIAAEGNPQVMDVHVIDEAGHLARTTFAYGETSTQPTLVDQWDYTFNQQPSQQVLRSTRTEYVIDQNYLSRNMRNLLKSIRVYEEFDPYAGTVDPGYPANISVWGWPGGFGADGIDAALYSGSKCYFFKGNQYIRVTRGDTDAGTTTTTFDGRGRTRTVRSQRPDGDVTFAYQFDSRNRIRAVSTPYRAGEFPKWDSIDYDALGRPTERIDFATASTHWYYNEAARPLNRATAADDAFPSVRIVDTDGTEQWRSFDGLKRLKDLVAPAPDGPGTVVPTGALCASYRYDGLSNISGIDLHATGMPLQQRRFRSDSLGRLVRQFLPEQGDGITETRGGVTEHWSTSFTYDTRSNLVSREDSRGVLTRFDYGGDPLDRLQHVTYSTTGFRDHNYPVVECPDVTYTYESSGDLRRVHQEICAGVSTQVLAYDPVFGLTSATVTMDSAPDHPFTIDYGHDELARPTTTTFPTQYGDGAGKTATRPRPAVPHRRTSRQPLHRRRRRPRPRPHLRRERPDLVRAHRTGRRQGDLRPRAQRPSPAHGAECRARQHHAPRHRLQVRPTVDSRQARTPAANGAGPAGPRGHPAGVLRPPRPARRLRRRARPVGRP